MTRAYSATGRAFMSWLIEGRDFEAELLAEQLAETYHAVACGLRKWPADHLENELVLFRVVAARMAEATLPSKKVAP